MKRLTGFQRFMIQLIGIAMILTLLLGIVKGAPPVEAIAAKGYGFFSLLRYSLIEDPLRSVTDFYKDLTNFYKLRQENEDLRQQIDLLAIYKARLEEAYRQIGQLKQQSNTVNAINEYSVISTTVIFRSVDNFNHVITIDVGHREGIMMNNAVITTKGLIGKVVEVQETYSVVQLLTTEKSPNRVSVKIQLSPDKTAEAYIKRYDIAKQAFELILLDTASSITENMTVITSGLGGVFPAGLLVGKVVEVEELVNAIGLKIFVKPAADFYSFDYAFVVQRKAQQVE